MSEYVSMVLDFFPGLVGTTRQEKWLRAHDNGEISFQGTGPGPYQTWQKVPAGKNRYGFRNLGTGLYLATNDKSEMGQDAKLGRRQTWTEVAQPGGRVALLGLNNRWLGLYSWSELKDLWGRLTESEMSEHHNDFASTRSDNLTELGTSSGRFAIRYVAPPPELIPEVHDLGTLTLEMEPKPVGIDTSLLRKATSTGMLDSPALKRHD